MKQNFYNIIACAAAVLLLAACEKSGDLPGSEPGSESIILDFSAGAAGRTPKTSDIPRAGGASDASCVPGSSGVSGVSSRSIADNEMESRVDHIDVLIFEGQEPYTKAHYERIVTSGRSSSGKVALTAKKRSFTKDKEYMVYLIANANDEDEQTFRNATSRNAFFSMWHKDRYIHLTGLPLDNSAGIALPQTFLMDGVAYASATEPMNAQPVVLNDGTNGNVFLEVKLRRAAVKLVLKIGEGDNVTFHNIGSESGVVTGGGYYLRNMPWTTLISAAMPEDSDGVLVRTTSQSRTGYYRMVSTETGKKMITVTAYVYSHSWERGSAVKREPRWILDIPLTYSVSDPNPDQEDPSGDYINGNYYQIPVCSGSKLERNTCYTVSLTLNRPGGTEPTKPVALEAAYEVADWNDTTVNIGGNEQPNFLTVNRTEMEMHNIDKDGTTLRFASSSAVTATVTAAYYKDKFGQTQQVSSSIRSQIKLTPDDGMSGNIAIESPVPTNNTIRYIEIEVTNKDGVEPRKVTIEQYPLEYITNIQGWYSTRSDFGGTSYENRGEKGYVVAESYDNRTKKWTYGRSSRTAFFYALYATPNGDGTSIINYYWWGSNGRNSKVSNAYNYNTGRTNARMYHVRITATSKDYTLGRPRITEGKTDPGADNAKLVSPSFMIASQLGIVWSSDPPLSDRYEEGIGMAASHCEQYVEVAKNGTVYNDWRLPTTAEINIIAKFQRTTGSAIDVVLGGRNYYSASEIVKLSQGDSGTYLRCIRDAYDAPEASKETDPAAGNQ